MDVKELIQKLLEFDMDTQVFIEMSCEGELKTAKVLEVELDSDYDVVISGD